MSADKYPVACYRAKWRLLFIYFFSFLKGDDLHSVICGSFLCPPYSKCESAGICVCTQCTHDGKKVCGSDGKTYNDLCELQRVACESNTPLKMTRKGSCHGTFSLLYFVCLHSSNLRGGERQRKLEMRS